MSDRTPLVLTLCSFPPESPERATLYEQLLAGAGEPRQVEAKFRDFVRRKFITNEAWPLAQLTAKGRQALADAGQFL